jgi:hypothetical protein
MDYPAFARRWRDPVLIFCPQRAAPFPAEHIALISRAEIYRIAMRLIEQHGDAAEIAVVLRAEQILDERTRDAVLNAIAELRSSRDRSRAH